MRKSDKISVLIVDDIADTRDNLRKLLYFERDIEVVGEAATGEEGIQKSRELHPDVVLMDINLQGMDGISATEAIRSQTPATQVIMMSVQGESEYLRRAMLAGAREFLIKPFGSQELADSIRRVHQLARIIAVPTPPNQPSGPQIQVTEDGNRLGKVVSIFSAKGGVGRTTVACNLAIALRIKTEKRVALVDCSLQFGDIGVLLNLKGNKTIVDLAPHLANLETEVLEGMMLTHSSGVRVLLAPPRPEMAELITADGVKRIINRLRERYDFVVVDTWPTFQDTVLATLDCADQIILLFALEIPAIKNLKLFLEVAEALGYSREKLVLVLNRADSTGGIRVGDVEDSLHHQIPVRIVSDGRLATYALNRGVPFVVSNPEAPLAQGIFSLAGLIVNGKVASTTDVTQVNGKDASSTLARLLAPAKLALHRRTAAPASSH